MNNIKIMALITKMAQSDDKLFRLFIADRIFDLMKDEEEEKKTFKEEYEEVRMK